MNIYIAATRVHSRTKGRRGKMSASSNSSDQPLSQDSHTSSQDSVRRVMRRYMSGSSQEAEPPSGGQFLPPGPGGLG